MSQKKNRGQFYTTNSSYILDTLPLPSKNISRIVEPFAGKGDLIDWIRTKGYTTPIESYDIEPKRNDILQRDTLKNPPDYTNAWILTNPPYLARNKSSSKDIYDLYDTNDLYKCFLTSLVQQGTCLGGIVIIPAGFFFSPRDVDVRCRGEFMKQFRITKVHYFEETVFEDTPTTIVAFAFEKAKDRFQEQDVLWQLFPSKDQKTFHMSSANSWIVGGEIYSLPIPSTITVRRYVVGQTAKDGEQQTHMTLSALDSGKQDGRICLQYKKDYVYPAKDCSRTYATLCITGITLSEQDQIDICKTFNTLLEQKRQETWSLFLPQYRESKDYARKRIPFELAYRIVLYILTQLQLNQTNQSSP
jgi:hypothetical protein